MSWGPITSSIIPGACATSGMRSPHSRRSQENSDRAELHIAVGSYVLGAWTWLLAHSTVVFAEEVIDRGIDLMSQSLERAFVATAAADDACRRPLAGHDTTGKLRVC